MNLPVEAAIKTFKNYPNIVDIKQREFNTIFGFNNTNENEVRKIVRSVDVCKTCQGRIIPTKII